MEYRKLGSTGLEVSRIALGCMTYGVPERGNHVWTLDEKASRPMIRRALELGINFFDTANSYSDGTSEEITGRALKDFAKRDEIVVGVALSSPRRRHERRRLGVYWLEPGMPKWKSRVEWKSQFTRRRSHEANADGSRNGSGGYLSCCGSDGESGTGIDANGARLG